MNGQLIRLSISRQQRKAKCERPAHPSVYQPAAGKEKCEQPAHPSVYQPAAGTAKCERPAHPFVYQPAAEKGEM